MKYFLKRNNVENIKLKFQYIKKYGRLYFIITRLFIIIILKLLADAPLKNIYALMISQVENLA